jgi:hypothetical protein
MFVRLIALIGPLLLSGGLFVTVYEAKSTGAIVTGGRLHQHYVYRSSAPVEFDTLVKNDLLLGEVIAGFGVVLFIVVSLGADDGYGDGGF